MKEWITSLLQATAWPIKTPRPYGPFHLLLTLAGVTAAVCLACRLSKRLPGAKDAAQRRTRPLLFCGLLLAVSEVYKQGFLYLIVNDGHYDWWYFPFQLCSVPMYLCLLLPLADRLERAGRPYLRGLSQILCTFLQDYALLGGVMALAEPSGLMHPYLTLTLHGFFWHFILIFLGLYCAMSGAAGTEWRWFFRTIPLFLLCCLIATAVNVAAHPYGNADMFYISPYYPNGQVVFHQISLTIGTLAGNILYLLSVLLGAALCHRLTRGLSFRNRACYN